MKRKDLIDAIERLGCVLIRHGAKHDIYHNPKTGMTQPVPRHREFKKSLQRKSFETCPTIKDTNSVSEASSRF